MKKFFILTFLLSGCAFFRWKPFQRVYTDLHELRLGIESISGVVPAVDLIFPMAPSIRVGLNEVYVLDQVGVEIANSVNKIKASEDQNVVAANETSTAESNSPTNQPQRTPSVSNKVTGN